MKSGFTAVTYRKGVWCVGCLPDTMSNADSSQPEPIFLGGTGVLFCSECGRKHAGLDVTCEVNAELGLPA